MRQFTSGEMGRMQVTQYAAMMDECELLSKTTTNDEYGMPVDTWAVTDSSPCGLSHSATNTEGMLEGPGGTQVALETRTLRLPINLEISNFGRIKVTHRFGVIQDLPVTYEVIGDPQSGPSGLLVQIKRLTT